MHFEVVPMGRSRIAKDMLYGVFTNPPTGSPYPKLIGSFRQALGPGVFPHWDVCLGEAIPSDQPPSKVFNFINSPRVAVAHIILAYLEQSEQLIVRGAAELWDGKGVTGSFASMRSEAINKRRRLLAAIEERAQQPHDL